MKTITSVKNEYITKLQKLLNKKDRLKEQLFLVEGLHLVEEAKPYLVSVLANDEKLLKKYSCDTYLVTDEIIKKLSTTVNPQPIIGVVKMLNHNVEILNDILKSPKSRILILDNLNDPGNLGTIIRSCVAFNIDTLLCLMILWIYIMIKYYVLPKEAFLNFLL